MGFGDGSSKNNGRSGCGVVIKGVHKNKWITISNIVIVVSRIWQPK